MLVQAIPAYRLPREELGREISMIESMGVTIETGKALGTRLHPRRASRTQGYDAVFLGVGAPDGMGLGIPGEDGEGVTEALTFLREYNVQRHGRGRQARSPSSAAATPPSTRPAPPSAWAPSTSTSSTAASASRCPPGRRRSSPPTRRASPCCR